MATQIKKKFLAPEVVSYFDDQIDSVESALTQELLDRASGDAAAILEAKGYTDAEIAKILSNTSTEALDSLSEIVAAFQAADSDLNGAITSISTALEGQIAQEILDRQAADTALDLRINSLEVFDEAQVRYVSKSGSDATGNGGQHKPFLSLSAAFASITDASPTKRYVIRVAAGNYTETAVELPPNVYVVGEGQKEAVRITGPVTMSAAFNQPSSFDNRSGFSNLVLLSAANFDWNTVQSPAGKLYFNQVIFGSTVTMYGYNNAIAQAQFNQCQIYGQFTVSGINVGVFQDCVCFGNIVLNQHPNGGMATIMNITGGYSNSITQTTTVNDFNRRCATFIRNSWCETLTVDGPSSYADVDLTSGSKQGAVTANGGQVIALNPVISHDLTTQMITPRNTNAHNMGDWGKQWAWNFAWLHASTGTDLYLISYGSSFGADSSGKSINIVADGAGLQADVNGGDINLETSAVSGTGVQGKVSMKARLLDMNEKKMVNLADGVDAKDAVNKSQLDAAIAAIPAQMTFVKEQYIAEEPLTGQGLAQLAIEASLNVFVGRLALHAGTDYTVSVVDDKTYLTWVGDFAVGGAEAIEAGDKIFVQYAVEG